MLNMANRPAVLVQSSTIKTMDDFRVAQANGGEHPIIQHPKARFKPSFEESINPNTPADFAIPGIPAILAEAPFVPTTPAEIKQAAINKKHGACGGGFGFGGPSTTVRNTKGEFVSFQPAPKDNKPEKPFRTTRSKPKFAKITNATGLTIADIHVHPMRSFKSKTNGVMIKTVKLSPAANKDPMTRIPFRIQFNGGGRIPFEIKTDSWGKLHTNLSITDEEEAVQLSILSAEFIDLALKMRKVWWPNDYEIMDRKFIKKQFMPIMFEADEKKESPGEFWHPKARVSIPVSMTTGEPAAIRTRSNQKICPVIDHDGAIVSIHDLKSRTWSKFIIDVSSIYFSGSYKWGISGRLSKLKLAFDHEPEAEYEEVDFNTDEEDTAPPQNEKKRGLDVYNDEQGKRQRVNGEEGDILTQEFNFPRSIR